MSNSLAASKILVANGVEIDSAAFTKMISVSDGRRVAGGFKMKIALSVLLTAALGFVFVAGLHAEEKKEVTLNGTILCAKCALKAEGVTKCTTAIKVKEGEKEVVY